MSSDNSMKNYMQPKTKVKQLNVHSQAENKASKSNNRGGQQCVERAKRREVQRHKTCHRRDYQTRWLQNEEDNRKHLQRYHKLQRNTKIMTQKCDYSIVQIGTDTRCRQLSSDLHFGHHI